MHRGDDAQTAGPTLVATVSMMAPTHLSLWDPVQS
jgi:hypothetical protein